MRTRAALLSALVLSLLATAPAEAANLRAGAGQGRHHARGRATTSAAGRAPTASPRASTRACHARALVLERGGRKVALVSIDLFMVPGGMVQAHRRARSPRAGFSEQNILISASHTHSGPGGYANFPTLNTAAPSLETIDRPVELHPPAQPRARRPAALPLPRRADRRRDRAGRRRPRARARPRWGSARIIGLTRNRSLEAHLANHGIISARGEGREERGPRAATSTRSTPTSNVLRVDKVVRRRGRGKRVRVPIGGWSTFADHGTVTKSSFEFYNADHHASAMRVFEARRAARRARSRRSQEVVNVYGNSNEGDMSAGPRPPRPGRVGLRRPRRGRARCCAPGSAAGRALTAQARRSTCAGRASCFCGQEVERRAAWRRTREVGLPFLTGSEEERGPLFDVTGEHFEDRRAPADRGARTGTRLGARCRRRARTACRCWRCASASALIVSVPGEGTKEVGRADPQPRSARRSRARASSAWSSPGLANEFVLYFTTPEEYDRQHYEGGNTQFGRLSSVLVPAGARRSWPGRSCAASPRRAPVRVRPDQRRDARRARPTATGPASGAIARPAARARTRGWSARALAWQGGREGSTARWTARSSPTERRAGAAAGRARRRRPRAWRCCGGGPDGPHGAKWEIPLDQPPGHATASWSAAKRYRLDVAPVRRDAPRERCELGRAPTRRGRAWRCRCRTRRRAATST